MEPFENKNSVDKNTNFSGSIIVGTRWTAFNKISSHVIKFVASVLLARLLPPQDFGLMAMGLVVIGFLDIYKDMGTVPAIVQRTEVNDEVLSSLFFLNILFGIICAAIVFAFSDVFSTYFKDSRLSNILKALSFTFVISSFSQVMKALLQRNLLFSLLTIVEVSALVIYGFVSILLAYNGFGVWSLVIGSIVSTFVSTVLYYFLYPWKPKFIFKFQCIRDVLFFSVNLSGAQTLAYFMLNVDRLVIGRFLGATSLGFYDLARRLLSIPGSTISEIIMRVLFPSLTSVKEDDDKITKSFTRASEAIAIVALPMLFAMCALAEPFVKLVYGEKWIPVIILIQILTPVAIVQTFGNAVGTIYFTKGRTDILLKWHIIAGLIFGISFYIGIKWGLLGVTIANLTAVILLAYHTFSIPFSLINYKLIEYVKCLKEYFTICIKMTFILYAEYFIFQRFNMNMNLNFAICVISGILVYLYQVLKSNLRAFQDFQIMITGKIRI